MTMQLIRSGVLTTVQDLGRTDYMAYGVAVGGAMDTLSLFAANLLIGNDPHAAGLEITLRGPELKLSEGRWMVLSGGEIEAWIDDVPIPMHQPVFVQAGEIVKIGAVRSGCRSYFAIEGGIDVPVVMGGRGTDLRAAFGGWQGRCLHAEDELPLGTAKHPAPASGERVARIRPSHELCVETAVRTLRVLEGVEFSSFEPDSQAGFFSEEYALSPQSDRMGLRFSGAPLQMKHRKDLITQGVVKGTVQVPPDGQPILLMADAQTTGGYPRIAQVAAVDLPVAAQLRPGDRIRFEAISIGEAEALLHEQEKSLIQLELSSRIYWKGRV